MLGLPVAQSAIAQPNYAKKPLLVLMRPVKAVSINKTCRYCPDCDILIAHQDELEKLLEQLRSQYFPDFVWEDYLVVGTIERKLWKEGTPYLGRTL